MRLEGACVSSEPPPMLELRLNDVEATCVELSEEKGTVELKDVPVSVDLSVPAVVEPIMDGNDELGLLIAVIPVLPVSRVKFELIELLDAVITLLEDRLRLLSVDVDSDKVVGTVMV